IILLDEPFGGLDAITKRKMQAWLLEVLETLNASVFFITHDIEEAILLSDRIYVLSERPASLSMEIPVNIERPRDPEIVTSQKFNEIRKQILELLR
ncbi:MAG: ABC transporter ATP-binding protein, partial [Peptostreptococcaceae bacterium]|nr:ABC transporter ATP-binding protein [Peptostreptococcaceae bacterium]